MPIHQHTLLVADDHEVTRVGIRRLLGVCPRWQVVAEACDGHEALALAQKLKPDVAVLGYPLPVMHGTEVAREMARLQLPTRTLIYSSHPYSTIAGDIKLADARGYFCKRDSALGMVAAIEALAVGRTFGINPLHNGRYPDGLTPREAHVVRLVADGHTSKQIARILEIAHKTIESHRSAAMRKTNCCGVAELVRYAVRHHLVVDP